MILPVAVIVLALLLLRKGSVHWKGDLSADGVATLLGGALAFLAVMVQLEADRNAKVAEQENLRRGQARAAAS